jgi:hypothetical protein
VACDLDIPESLVCLGSWSFRGTGSRLPYVRISTSNDSILGVRKSTGTASELLSISVEYWAISTEEFVVWLFFLLPVLSVELNCIYTATCNHLPVDQIKDPLQESL